jgi:hypothetical protein
MGPAARYPSSGRKPDDGVRRPFPGRGRRGLGVRDAGRHAASQKFAGLFGAAPSVALATPGIAVYRHGAGYAAQQSWAMTAGAIALAVYGLVVCQLLIRARLRAAPASLLSLVVWLIVAFGLFTLAGGQT